MDPTITALAFVRPRWRAQRGVSGVIAFPAVLVAHDPAFQYARLAASYVGSDSESANVAFSCEVKRLAQVEAPS
jgi:hypothetical protein